MLGMPGLNNAWNAWSKIMLGMLGVLYFREGVPSGKAKIFIETKL